ncbi:MAG: GNAT family N-acetyltransferase [Ktedonobacteraceae bacterium]
MTQGIFAKQKLTEDEIAAIQQLATLCNTFEGLHMRLFGMDMFKQRSGNETLDFLYYEQGLLVGYLGIDNYGTKQKELINMVHPEHRRQGIGSQLLQAAKEEGRHSGIEKLILTCERVSASGRAFAQAVHAHLDYSEHEMVLRTFKERFVFDERLTFRQAESLEDLDMVMSIMATDIGGDSEAARKYVTEMVKHANQRFYLMTFGGTDLGCDEPLGSLRLEEMEQMVGIYGFVVRPEYRGRGYGRLLLQEVIPIIRNEGSKGIMLEVDVDNTNALGLYLSCGFEITTTYDYYTVEVV